MLGIDSTELAIILLFAFLLFGPDKLPQAGRTIGRALRQFRETQEKLTNVVQTEVVDPMAAAAKAPVKKGSDAPADDDGDLDVTASDAPEDAAAPIEPAEPEVPAEPSIEDLYARRPSRRAKRAAAPEQAAPEQAEAEPAAEPERTSGQAEAAESPASDSEEGGER